MFDYTNKVVAITGASSGLGKQMAEGFAKCHANLVLLARRVERLEAYAKEFEQKYNVKVLPVMLQIKNLLKMQLLRLMKYLVTAKLLLMMLVEKKELVLLF